MKRIEAEKINRVLVRGVNWIGDAVMSVPALRALRDLFPRAHLTLATRAWARDVFADADFVDEILVLEKETFAQIKQFRSGNFDLAILFPNAFQPAFAAFAAYTRFRVGYATERRSLLLTHALPVPAWRATRHETFYYLNIIAELEAATRETRTINAIVESNTSDVPASLFPKLNVSERRRADARELLCERGATVDRPLVVLCPGSTNSRAKRWATASYANLADLLIENLHAQVALVGAREEEDVSHEVASKMKREPVFLTGRLTLAESITVLSVADLFIGNDTGPAHIAAALSRPTLVIFGPTKPETTRPLSPFAEIIRRPPACAPCMLRDCPIDHRCMKAISPEEVFARAEMMLKNVNRESLIVKS